MDARALLSPVLARAGRRRRRGPRPEQPGTCRADAASLPPPRSNRHRMYTLRLQDVTREMQAVSRSRPENHGIYFSQRKRFPWQRSAPRPQLGLRPRRLCPRQKVGCVWLRLPRRTLRGDRRVGPAAASRAAPAGSGDPCATRARQSTFRGESVRHAPPPTSRTQGQGAHEADQGQPARRADRHLTDGGRGQAGSGAADRVESVRLRGLGSPQPVGKSSGVLILARTHTPADFSGEVPV